MEKDGVIKNAVSSPLDESVASSNMNTAGRRSRKNRKKKAVLDAYSMESQEY